MPGVTPSQWAVDQFGDQAEEVMRRVVTGLARGQQAARSVQAAAVSAGAADKRAYGSTWATRYGLVVKQFELTELPGYEPLRPKGASYNLAVVNGRVLIPFRHATSLKEPISRARLGNRIPHQVSRENDVEPALTLFDIPGSSEATTDPSVAEAAAAAVAEKLKVIYVAYVSNADSDEVLAAWWGTPDSLEDDGTMLWSPERLDLSIATQNFGEPQVGLAPTGTGTAVLGFADGEPPSLDVTSRPETAELPFTEPEPATRETEDGDG